MAKEVSWEKVMAKWCKITELRVRYWAIISTPAIEIKRLALEKIEKELKALMEE